MNKLYFRVWNRQEKKMFEVSRIDLDVNKIWCKNGNYTEVLNGFEVELLQGMKINGKVIYVGDIVRYSLGGCIDTRVLKEFRSLITLKDFDRMVSKFDNIEVLGNIYENKELINNV